MALRPTGLLGRSERLSVEPKVQREQTPLPISENDLLRGTILVLMAALTLGGCATSVAPSVAPAPPFPGRLLVLDWDRGGSANLLQLTSGSRSPANVGTARLSGDINSGEFVKSVSADGAQLVLSDGTLATFGADAIEQLPDWGTVNMVSFSPDGKRLAYAVEGGEGRVVVYDLAAKTGKVVLQTPCATYSAIGGVCGQASGVVWIGPTTLFVWHFAGDMPENIYCPGANSCGDQPLANTYSIITASGFVVASVPAWDSNPPVLGHGNTVVFADGTWLDLDQVRAGVETRQPPHLPTDALRYSLSGDGSRVAVSGDPWRLVDLRTGAVQELGTRAHLSGKPTDWNDGSIDATSTGIHVAHLSGKPTDWNDTGSAWSYDTQSVWSPDGQFLAVQDGNDIIVVPVSTASGGTAGTTPSNTGNTELIGWGL